MTNLEKFLNFLLKLLFLVLICWIIVWFAKTINTWTACLISMADSLKQIVTKF